MPEMKKQDTEESPTQGSEDAPPISEGTESPAAAKDSLDSNSPKESEPQTPQTDTPPQSDEAGSEGKFWIIYKVVICRWHDTTGICWFVITWDVLRKITM